MDVSTGQLTRAFARHTVLMGLALGCLLAFARFLFQGPEDALGDAGALVWPGAADALCLAQLTALVVLTLLGLSERPVLGRWPLVVAGALAFVGSIAFTGVSDRSLQIAAAVVVGLASGTVMFSVMMLFSSRSTNEIVVACLWGLVAGGLLIVILSHVDATAFSVMLAAVGFAPGLLVVCDDPTLECCRYRGEVSPEELRRFPWFSALAFVVCDILGTFLYRAGHVLSWDIVGASPAVLLVAVMAVIAATMLLMTGVSGWSHVVWFPLFALVCVLICCLIVSGTPLSPLACALLLATALCCHFLRWLVVPALVSTSLLPPALLGGCFLVVTSLFLDSGAGSALAGLLSASAQLPSVLAGLAALALAVLFAVVAALYQIRRGLDESEQRTLGVDERAQLRALIDEKEQLAQEVSEARAASTRPSEPDIDAKCDVLAAECGLTQREREICAFTARGYASSYIAEQLSISSSTVRFHQQNLYRKVGVHSKQELIKRVEAVSCDDAEGGGMR